MSTNDSIISENTLLAALRAGDEWAFDMMVRKFGGRLLAVATRLTRNEEDARDVVQSTYLSAFRGVHTFRGDAQLSTWLHRIVVNQALMKMRARQRTRESSIEDLLPTFQADGHHAECFSDDSLPADETIARAEASAIVRACIQQLPDNYRIVLMLRDIDELPTTEVAELMAMTPLAVKVRLHRARQALATLLRRAFAFHGRASSPAADVQTYAIPPIASAEIVTCG